MAPTTYQLYLKNESQIGAELFDWESFTYREALNGRGGWVLVAPEKKVSDHFRRLDWDHTNASSGRLNGAGLVLAQDGKYVYHGVRQPSPNYRRGVDLVNDEHPANNGEGVVGVTARTASNDEGTATIAGLDDLGFIGNRVYVPGSPSGGQYPEISGNLGTVIPDLIESQVGAAAVKHRRFPNWSFTTSTISGGSTVALRPAYGNLLATCNEFLDRWDGDPLYMKLTQDEDGLTFSVEELTLLDQTFELGTGLSASRYEITPAKTNTVYAVAFDANGDLEVTHYSALANALTDTMPDFDYELGYEVVESVADLSAAGDGEADTALVDSSIGGVVNLGGTSMVVTPSADIASMLRVGCVVPVVLRTPEYAHTASKSGELLQLPVVETETTLLPTGERSDKITLGAPLANPLIPTEDPGRPFFPSER